jgi:hypothetical protein
MRKTALRSPAMHTKYLTYPKDPDFMKNAPSIVDYQYWRIINNKFPYDSVAKVHHMLVPKRQFAHPIEINKMETVELDTIIATYLDDYDAIMLNLPKARTIPNWLHYHLLTFKNVL